MRVLVCGGRDFNDYIAIRAALDALLPIKCLIHGGARGADANAAFWARQRNVPIECHEAKWDVYGPSAGPKRNQEMIDQGRPDVVVAFPGGRGTADMVRRAELAKVKVITVNKRK